MALRVFLTHNPEDLEAYYGRALDELQALDVEISTNPADHDLSTGELIRAAAGCEVIVAHRATPGEAELFATSPNLIAFLRTAVDISTIDVTAATSAGVLVGHADKSFVASTAELALGLLIDAARNIASSTADYRAGRVPPQRPGRQIRGMTAAVIGYGAIGAYLVDLLNAAGLNVLICDPFVDLPPDVPSVSFDEAIALRRQRADLSRETSSLVSAMLAKTPGDRPTAAAVRSRCRELRANACRG